MAEFEKLFKNYLERSEAVFYGDLNALLLDFNLDFKEEVSAAKDKHNLRIRNYFSDKMGLSLTNKSRESDYTKQEYKEKGIIQIEISDKIPKEFIEIVNLYDFSFLRLLLHYNQISNSIGEINFQMEYFERFSQFTSRPPKLSHLEKTMDYLLDLFSLITNSEIWNDLNSIHPDQLGTYAPHTSIIELHWLSISFLSKLHNDSVEDVLILVLAHELAHGYTHLGYDKDGNRWETEPFLKADRRITEGFAQIYTFFLLKDYFPSALRIFNRMLRHSPIQYVDFMSWFDSNDKILYEKTRRLLLITRNKQIVEYSEFKEVLKKIKKD